ncbi:MAG TPA: hypothetical protein VNU69_03865 [Rhizomicrobium sp.]|jgi:hypothetical protein|nr:hypothetical protein [Rhizomicrobium sp.]
MRKPGLVLLCFLSVPAWADGISQDQALKRAKDSCGDEFCGISPSHHPHWQVTFVNGEWRAQVMDDTPQSQQCGFVFEVAVPNKPDGKPVTSICITTGVR